MNLDGAAEFMRTSSTRLNVEMWFDLEGDETAEQLGHIIDEIEEFAREKAKEL